MRLDPKSIAATALITALAATGPLSTDMYLPALPEIRQAFGASTSDVQLTLSVFLFGLAFAQLVLGPLSDRFGRRPVLICSMTLYFVMSLLCVFAPTLQVLTIARFFQAVGVCAGGVVGRAVVRDIHGRGEAARMMSHISTAIAVAPLIAPLIGGQLAITWGWQSVFMVMAGIGVVMTTLSFGILPETNQWQQADALNPKRFVRNYKILLMNSEYRRFMFSSAFVFSGLFAFISGSSFVLIESLGMKVEHFGFAFGFVVVGYMFGAQLSGQFTKRLGLNRMVDLGGKLAISSGALGLALQFILPPSVFSIIVPMALYLVSVGLILPNSMAGAIGPHEKMAGTASALLGFVQMSMAAGAGIIVGYTYNGTSIPMMTVVASSGLITWYFSRSRRGARVRTT